MHHLDIIKENLSELKSVVNNPIQYLADYLGKIKNKIDAECLLYLNRDGLAADQLEKAIEQQAKMIDEVHRFQRQCLENLETSDGFDAIDLDDLEHRYKINVGYGRSGLMRGFIDLDEDIYCLLYKRRKLLLNNKSIIFIKNTRLIRSYPISLRSLETGYGFSFGILILIEDECIYDLCGTVRNDFHKDWWSDEYNRFRFYKGLLEFNTRESLKKDEIIYKVNVKTTQEKALSMIGNKMSRIPEGLFNGLVNLYLIDISRSRIQVIPEGVFSRLVNLTLIDISRNLISVMPEGVFNGLVNLQAINISRNEITVIPEGLFSGLVKLEGLKIHGNKISAIPQGLLKGLVNLHAIDMSRNGISVIPEGLFTGLVKLKRLWIYGNKISVIPEGLLNGLHNLYLIDISRNSLSVIPEGLFKGKVNLTEISMSFNRITAIEEDMFQGLDKLRELNVLGNNISVIPEGFLNGQVNIRH